MLVEQQKGSNEIIISGNIKTIGDSQQIKDILNSIVAHGSRNLHLKISDSFSMTSEVIGHLMKLTGRDQVKLTIIVGDNRLYKLLVELCLVKAFNVRVVAKDVTNLDLKRMYHA